MDDRVNDNLTPQQKAAILCVALGPESAAKVFKHLSDDIVDKLAVEMVRTQEVGQAQARAIQIEMIEKTIGGAGIQQGGVRYARDVLTRALGESRAENTLERIANRIETTPFEFLRLTPPDQIYAFLRSEHPQTVALVIANLPAPELAASVIALLAPEEQSDIALRIALMGQLQPDVVKEVARVMESKLDVVVQAEYSPAGGVASLADILNNSDRPTERNILDYLSLTNPELAENVRALLFVFDDLLKLDDRTIQLVLKEVDQKDLALSLRGASVEVTDRILENMSQRAAETLREEMEFMPPQLRRVVEEAQTKVVAVVRRLEEDGTIIVARGGSEAEMVI
jgi:flagellar motor switch protein FliG